MRRLAGALMVISLVGAPIAVHAQGAVTDAEQIARQAAASYKAKDFQKAVDLYLEAYGRAPAPAMLYNIAHIYERKLNQPDLAVDFYRRVLRDAGASTKMVQKATARLTALRALAEQREAERQAAEREAAERREREQAPAVLQPPPRRPDNSGMILGVSLAGAGVAAIGAGVYFGLAAKSTQDDFDKSHDPAQRSSLEDDGVFQAGLADGFLVGGVILGAVGVTLMLMGGDDDTSHVSVSPTEGGAAVMWGGAL